MSPRIKIVGVGVTTHSETPGLGSKAKTDPKFAAQFKDMSLNEPFAVKDAGGQIDALSGATVTSKGVSLAATQASEIYKRLKPEIVEKLKTMGK
jgi:electron transport complex protein RnfG